jgi:DNA-binding SARP family transcriptional activator/serine/threonine protein kinase/WD40 repeat protein
MRGVWKTGITSRGLERNERSERVEFRVLGPVEVLRDGVPVDLGVYKQRALLALLLIDSNRVVSTDRIIDELWGEDAGRDRQNALWVVVSRLRSILDPDRERRSDETILVTQAPGYMLAIDPADLDATRFDSLFSEGRSLVATDPAAASVVLHEALALWRGHALEEFTYESFAVAAIARLEETRLTAVEDRIGADLRLGRERQLVGELEALVHQHPLREAFTRHLMVALHRAGRQAEALRAFGAYRTRLGDELGLEPSPQLAELEERIMLNDPGLIARAAPDQAEPGKNMALSVRGYELREKIGEGSIGDVYRGFQPALGREIAIQVVRAEWANEPEFIRHFEADTHLIAALDHPNIAPILDYWREPDSAYVVMRRFDQGNLADAIDSGTVSEDQAMKIILQVAAGLEAAHRKGVTHGGLRPETVLMDAEGNAYLSDFGTPFTTGHAGRQTAPDNPLLAPELHLSGRPSRSSDLYSLGVLAGVLLETGSPAEAGTGSATVVPVANVIGRATAADPNDRFPDVGSFVTALTSAVAEPPPVDGIPAPNPYRGLRAFGEDDTEHFYGRERVVERLVARLGHPGPQGRLVVLVGPSGSGKSSVVRAGVVPAIRQGALPRSDDWFVITMTPGNQPYEALEDAVRTVAVRPPGNLLEQLQSDGLVAATATMADTSSQLLLIVDQLEELFSLASPADADAFLDTLAAATDKHSRVKVVATLRADFYDHPLRHRSFGEALRLGTEVLTPMSGDELERAITLPSQTGGVGFESGLVARIVSDIAGNASPLPLLQYTLTELYELRTGSTVTNSAYDRLGGVSAALAARADDIYLGLDPSERTTAREIFLRLVTLNEAAADTRRRALRSELEDGTGARVPAILDVFGRHRLLTFDRDTVTRTPTVEIAHEALLSEWTRLARWIDDARLDVQAQRRLAAAASEWEDREQNRDFLLTGAQLARYEGWLDDPPVRLTVRERRFLTAATETAEAARDAERHRVRRLRRLVAGIGALLVVAVTAGGFAVSQQQQAQQAAEEAEAQTVTAIEAAERAELATLISRSAAVGADDPELGLLLALEAHRRSPGSETGRAVLQALSGASIANRIVTRSPLPDDCFGASSLRETFAGEVEFATFEGRMLMRDPLVGAVVDLGPPPTPCAVGAIHQGVGAAVTLDLSRAWIGADLALELNFDVPTIPEWLTRDRFVLRSGLFEDEPDSVSLHDSATGARLGSPVSGEIWLDIAVNDDESLYAISFVDRGPPEVGLIDLLDGVTGSLVTRVELDGGPQELAFDPTSGNLVAGLLGGRIVTIDHRTGAVVRDVQSGEMSGFLDIAPDADGTITAVSQGAITVIDADTGATVRAIELRNAALGFIRPDGLVVTQGLDGQIDVFDPTTGAAVERSWRVDPTGLVAFHAGRAAVLSPTTQMVEVVDLGSGERFSMDLRGRTEGTFTASVAYPEEDGVWAISLDHELVRWRSGELVERLSLGSNSTVVGVRIGRTLTAARLDDTLAVLGRRSDGTLETSVVTLGTGGAVIESIVDTPDAFMVHPALDGGLYVVTADGTVRTFDTAGSPTAQIASGQVDAYVMTLDPTGRLLALGSEDGGLTIVDTVSAESAPVSTGEQIANLGFGPDGRVLAIVHLDGTVRLWDTDRREAIGVVLNGTGGVTGEPGRHDPSTGNLWMAVSGAIVEIPLEADQWVARACQIVDRDLTQDEWDRFVPGEQAPRSACR